MLKLKALVRLLFARRYCLFIDDSNPDGAFANHSGFRVKAARLSAEYLKVIADTAVQQEAAVMSVNEIINKT
jgi:hypothetical protein